MSDTPDTCASELDSRPVVLIVNHNKTDACGVYQMGKRTAAILAGSKRYRFVEVRCDSREEFAGHFTCHLPVVCIYNYYPGTMDWCHDTLGWAVLERPQRTAHVGTIHEITHGDAQTPCAPFARWIVNDPSFPESSIYFKTVRPLPGPYTGSAQPPQDRLTIGSYGFALPGKGFEYVIDAVAQEFGVYNPLLRLHVPRAKFSGDFPVEQYWAFLADRAKVQRIDCEITTDFRPDQESLEFLSSHHLNCLFYGSNEGRGISSAADYCIASGRPLAITKSEQFRHILPTLGAYPQVRLTDTLREGTQSVRKFQKAWSHERFIADYEGIVDSLLGGGG